MTFYGDGLICDIKLQDKKFMSGTKEDAYLMVFIRIALPQIGENLVLRYGTSIYYESQDVTKISCHKELFGSKAYRLHCYISVVIALRFLDQFRIRKFRMSESSETNTARC